MATRFSVKSSSLVQGNFHADTVADAENSSNCCVAGANRDFIELTVRVPQLSPCDFRNLFTIMGMARTV
jgi:hypothetical protein